MKKTDSVIVNAKMYKRPVRQSVIVCMDGISPEYISGAIEAGVAGTFERFKENGFYGVAEGVIPSLTNPNNISILTGVLPWEHGIVTSGIAFERKIGKYEIISSPEYIKHENILQRFCESGAKVASITTKDKLRHLLSVDGGINISAEVAHRFENVGEMEMIKNSIERTKKEGLLDKIDEEWMYSEKSSSFSLDLGIKLLEGKGPYVPEIMYISLTDFIPHRYAPGTENANNYIKCIDERINVLDKMGCVIGMTADHGMNAKHDLLGEPNAIWLKDILEERKITGYNILLPITDRYFGHHSCLGGCAWIYLNEGADVFRAMDALKDLEGIEEVLLNNGAARKYDLPENSIGDIFLLADGENVFGATRKEHGEIPRWLRSHGSTHEQKVPFIINKSLNMEYELKKERGLRNFNIFEYALNGVE